MASYHGPLPVVCQAADCLSEQPLALSIPAVTLWEQCHQSAAVAEDLSMLA